MRYRATQTLNLGKGKLVRAGALIPGSYRRLQEAIKRGWAVPASAEESEKLHAESKKPPPSLVDLPSKRTEKPSKEPTAFFDAKAREEANKDESEQKKKRPPDQQTNWTDDDKKGYKVTTPNDTKFDKDSPVDTGAVDFVAEAKKDTPPPEPEGEEGTGIGLDTLVTKLPFIRGKAVSGLEAANIKKVGDLAGKTASELTKIVGIGDFTAGELLETFAKVTG